MEPPPVPSASAGGADSNGERKLSRTMSQSSDDSQTAAEYVRILDNITLL
jgi:hypothetical protein